jgi:hypothetical protein
MSAEFTRRAIFSLFDNERFDAQVDRWANDAPGGTMCALAMIIFAGIAPAWALEGQLKSADAILARYKQALGGVDAIAMVQSETVRGEIDGSGMNARTSFVYLAKPFKTLIKVARANGTEAISGFDGSVSWSIDPQGASIDKVTLTGGPSRTNP